MTEKQEIISDDEFRIIFSYKRVRELLLMDVASYPLIYYFMNYFIASRLYKKREYYPSQKHLGFIKFNNINRLLKTCFFYIKSSLEKNETLKIGLDVLFFSRDRFIGINTEYGKIKSDYLFWSVIHEINKNHPDWKVVMISTADKSLPPIDDIKSYSIIHYCTPMIFLKSVVSGTMIYLKWKLSRSKMSRYLKDNECEYAVSLFGDFFNPIRLFFLLIRDYSLQNVLKKTKTRVIMANDDVLQLKPNNLESTKFIIMQSASIDEMNEGYKKMFLSSFPLDKLIADYFLVPGTKFKDMKKDAKDSERIMVTGQPRYDVLFYADKIYSKEKFLKEYKINPDLKIVLWATRCHGLSDEENKKNFRAVFKAMQDLKGTTLIIKQHPGEGEKYTKMIKDYLGENKISAVVMPKSSDTYEQLFVCDLMITKNSTTAMEAVALNKPVIILNLSGEPDSMEYVKEGVALGVYKNDDLKQVIEKLLEDDLELAKNRKRYIEKYLYKIDGKATDRVVKLIEEMINERQKRDGT